MSGSDMLYNQIYKNIDRPYANVDLSKIPSWDLVMSIMEQQAMEARRQIMARYQESQQTPQSHPMMMPKTIEYQYYNNQNCSPLESDSSSFCSDEMDSSPATSSDSDMSLQSDSDIEIDVDSIEEESDDYFMPSIDNIPITVLQLETKLREKELKRSS